jgi:hypothetical protein
MPDSRASLSSASISKSSYTTDQLNSTALKWGEDGELSELDLRRILTLLSQADPVAEALVASISDPAN